MRRLFRSRQLREATRVKLAIRVRGLTKRFGRQLIFEKLDLDVIKGEILGIAGGSGAGKSVLLRTILGLLPFETGTIEVFGKGFHEPVEHGADRHRTAVGRAVPGWRAVFVAERASKRPGANARAPEAAAKRHG